MKNTIKINRREVPIDDIVMGHILDTDKFKVKFNEYEKYEPFIEFLDSQEEKRILVKVDKETLRKIVELGFDVQMPNGVKTRKREG